MSYFIILYYKASSHAQLWSLVFTSIRFCILLYQLYQLSLICAVKQRNHNKWKHSGIEEIRQHRFILHFEVYLSVLNPQENSTPHI